MSLDLRIIVLAKLNLVSVLKVRDEPPRSLPQYVALPRRHTHFGCALLKLDCVTPCEHGRIDKLLGNTNTAVMVEPDLRYDINWLRIADQASAKRNLRKHS